MLKRFITSVGVISALLVPSMLVDLPQAQAYTNYDSCVAGQSVRLYPNGGATDAQFNQIETGCRSEFPGTSDPNRPLGATVNGNSSATPRATASSSTTAEQSVTPSASASSSSSARPTSDTSSTPNSSIPSSSATSASSSSANSTNTTGTRSGPTQPSMFSDHSDPNSNFRNPATGANPTDAFLGNYAQPLIRIGDRQLAFQILVNFFLGIISVVALLFLVFNGYRYAMARGEDSQISQAKKGITYSLIGLILVLAAYTIVATVLNFGAQSSPAPGLNVSVGVSL